MGSFLNDDIRTVELSPMFEFKKNYHVDYKTEPIELDKEIINKLSNLNKKDSNVFETIGLIIKLSPKFINIIYLVLKLIIGLQMNNDKKTTILGFVKSIMIALLTIFFADKVAAYTGIVEAGIYAIGAVWTVVELIMGILTNKPEKK